jgi:hypothetical protein
VQNVSQITGELEQITYPQAVGNLLGYITSESVQIGAQPEYVGIWVDSGAQSLILADYRAAGDPKFDRFWRFADIIDKLLWALRHEFDESVECYSLEGFTDLVERRAKGHPYPPFTAEAHRSIGNLVRYAAGWLLGREIMVPYEGSDDHEALCLALEYELQDGIPLELTFAELRSA